MDLVPTLILIGLLLFFGIGSLWVRNEEKKAWNGGFSKKSGLKWVLFDVDSQGGRMYKDNAGDYCCITYEVDN